MCYRVSVTCVFKAAAVVSARDPQRTFAMVERTFARRRVNFYLQLRRDTFDKGLSQLYRTRVRLPGSVKRSTPKGLRERVFDHAQPCIEVGAEGGGESSKRRGDQLFTRGRLPPDHRNRFRLRAFGFKPSLLAAD